jgi:hypothetical protein
MGNATSAELASQRGEVKISNYTGRTVTLVFSREHISVLRKATTSEVNFGIQGNRSVANEGQRGGGGGGLTFGASSSADTTYFLSQIHSIEQLDYRREADSVADGYNDDTGRGIMYYIGPNKGEAFYMTVFIDGTPRFINKGFRGGNSIVFQARGTVTFRDVMNFNGYHEQTSCGNWTSTVPVNIVAEIPPGFLGLQPLSGQH